MSDQETKRYLHKAYAVKTDADTRALYDKWACGYDEELTENGYAQPQRCANMLASQMPPSADRRVLDVGCGSGLSGIALAEAGYRHLSGCDFSPGMLAKAGQTGVYRHLFETNLNEPPMDAPDAHFDAATCVGVFSFGHVKADALDDIVRVIKPQGFLVIGLNDHYFQEGSLTAKLEAMQDACLILDLASEPGEHIPATGLTGWVITARKSA